MTEAPLAGKTVLLLESKDELFQKQLKLLFSQALMADTIIYRTDITKELLADVDLADVVFLHHGIAPYHQELLVEIATKTLSLGKRCIVVRGENHISAEFDTLFSLSRKQEVRL